MAKSVYIRIIAVCIALSRTYGDCPEQCQCELINAFGNETRVTCAYKTGTRLTDIPQNLSDSVTHLNISGHNISTIHPLPYHNLVHLFLENNCIKNIQPNAFERQKSLSRLILSGNKLEAITNQIFNDLEFVEYLILQKNNISKFMKESFDGRYMKRLKKIDLSYNNIVSTEGAFVNLDVEELNFAHNRITTTPSITNTRLEAIILDHNNIQFIQENDLQLYPTLTILQLSNNHLRNISSKAFKSTTNLRDLFLDYNNITHVYPGTFNNLSVIANLGLSWNRLETLDENVLPWNKNLMQLRLFGNPWNCVCSMMWLSRKKESEFWQPNTASDFYTCSSPASLKNRHITSLTAADFQCASSRAHARLVMVVALIFSAALILVIGWFIYTVRRRRQQSQYLRPAASSVYKKVTEPSVIESTSLAFSEDDSRKLVYSDANERVNVV